MNIVLGGKLDAIAYMPIETISEKIIGMPDYAISDLMKITKYEYGGH